MLTSAILDVKKRSCRIEIEASRRKERFKWIGFGNGRGRGRGRGRGWNAARDAYIQCYNCGEFGHIVRTCPHLIQAQGDSEGVNQTQTSYVPSRIPGRMNSTAGSYSQILAQL